MEKRVTLRTFERRFTLNKNRFFPPEVPFRPILNGLSYRESKFRGHPLYMKTDPKVHLVVSPSGVEQIEVLYPPGQREGAWLICRQLLPHLERLDCTLTNTTRESPCE